LHLPLSVNDGAKLRSYYARYLRSKIYLAQL
jgi:hypothetical protein